MRYLILTIALSLSLAASAASAAELAVIVNPDSRVESMSRDDVVNIFMGRYRRLPSGVSALPVDLEPVKATFYRNLVGRTLSEVNSYWARLVFSGRGSPPRQIDNSREVLEIVATNRGAIGYIPLDQADDSVRVVLTVSGIAR